MVYGSGLQSTDYIEQPWPPFFLSEDRSKKKNQIESNPYKRMMMSSKGANFECCMCGDSGLSYELFRCKVCQFRSQHRYCSNLYPKAESYRVCNWCLIQRDENAATTSNSSADQDPKSTKKKYSVGVAVDHQHKIACATSKSMQPASPVKKQRPVAEGSSPSPTGRKRVVGAEDHETETTNGSATPVTRHVFRNKVRRYKLLEEVSS
ncbi:hypothetical protein V2J09_000887 [Rumex salicifolius]